MELKLPLSIYISSVIEVLIVPYGIETLILLILTHILIVLIVPYGIETVTSLASSIAKIHVLIVPYGIETSSESIPCKSDFLF